MSAFSYNIQPYSNELATRRQLTRIHLLLSVQTVIIILGSINRLSSLTTGYVAQNQFLRWVDLINMLVLPLISVAAYYLLKKQLEYDSSVRHARTHQFLSLLFVVGIYLFAAGYGAHEVTNYLHVRFCLEDRSQLCQIIIFNDDEFSHWVFFGGFMLINLTMIFLQLLFPTPRPLAARDIVLLCVNALFVALGIFANLAFEEIGLDLVVVALVTIVASALFWWKSEIRAHLPLLLYYSSAYTFGLIATVLYKGGFS